jgi:lipopolysaccharide biosynthesis glycosyltransferase
VKQIIPIFFATDENYAPYLSVTLESMLANASKDCFYKIHVLTSKLSDVTKARIEKSLTKNSSIEYVSLTKELDKVSEKLHLRDYYSKETYYRFFIANLYPQYDKVLYLDCDIIVLGDIAELYNVPLGNRLVAACQEEVMATVKVFGDYVEKALDVPCADYFNAGILLMNAKLFREEDIESQFVELLGQYKFRVTQDQDYLNVLCKGRTKQLHLGWNKTAFDNPYFNEKMLRIIHYKMTNKPWRYSNVKYADFFWKYAKHSPFYKEILQERDSYGELQRQRDIDCYANLVEMAREDTVDPNNYKNSLQRKRIAL